MILLSIQLQKHVQVFLLHFRSCRAQLARRSWLREQYLIDYQIVYMNLEILKLRNQTFSFVKTQELRNTHCDKCCKVLLRKFIALRLLQSNYIIYRIFELRIDFLDGFLHSLQIVEHFLDHHVRSCWIYHRSNAG